LLIVRQNQLLQIQYKNEQFRTEMKEFLQNFFPEQISTFSMHELDEKITQLFNRSTNYGLFKKQDYLRFFSLCMIFGDNWEHQPEQTWMHERMQQNHAGDVSQRLYELYQQCLYRLEESI